METTNLVKKYTEEMIAIRRHIHANPELSNAEFKTTELIKEKLTEYGVEIADIGLKTGVLGIIRGGKPGKTVAIREDIDALPMPELTGLPYASTVENVCHSCGHDIHTTVLLCCAKVLSEIKDELAGNVMLIFQPAEEGGGGAQQVADCKFYEVLKPDAFVGLHVSALLDGGQIGVRKGPTSASSDVFTIKVNGKGGHGAHPENCIDPIAIAGYIITQLQTVVSRENHPAYPAVMTIGSIHAGKAYNIVPDFVEMGGTLRSLDPDCRKNMKDAITRIATCCAEGMRGSADVIWESGVPPLVNDGDVVDGIIAAATKIIGEENVVMLPNPSLGSEDFSVLFPEYGPGAQFSVGTGIPGNPDSKIGLHNSKNVFNEESIDVGASVIIQYVRDFLS
ncbi:MAG: amidohydrolase [Lachnospiraceae bacterium]|nr:amidohydrolase [Lachnospiraceae bacterium]